MRPGAGTRPPAAGFTYLGLMFLIAVLGLTAAMAGVVWRFERQRQDEEQLAFVGNQYRVAIERYRRHSEALGLREAPYPRRLEDLLYDTRGVRPVRHLRRLFDDPITRRADWGLLRQPDGGIVGVHSLSDRRPISRSVAAAIGAPLAASSYREWRFTGMAATLAAPGS